MNRRKLLIGLLVLGLLGILFSAGGSGPSRPFDASSAGFGGAADSSGSVWGFGRDTYRAGGAARDGAAARDRNTYQR